MNSICDRTPQVREAIAAQFGVPCDKVKMREVAEIRVLDLSHKVIDKLQPGDFVGLDNLTFLALNNNYLEEIPDGLFAPLPNLEELRLENNSLTRLDDKSLDGLQNSLKKLIVRNNDLSTLIVEKFRYLKTLSAYSNKLGLGSGLSFLIELPELENLFLSGNELNSVDIDNFYNLPKLKDLDLSFNHLQMIIDFRERFPLLENLDLGHNRIRLIPEGLLFSGVETISLNDNQIFSLPGEIPPGSNVQLRYMNIFGNPIIGFPKWAKEMDEAMKLTMDYDSLPVRCGLAVRRLLGL